MIIYFIIAAVIALLLAIVIFISRTRTYKEQLPYKTKHLFISPTELSFFKVLQQVVSDKYIIFSQVSMGRLFSIYNNKDWLYYFRRISQKSVDFVIVDAKTLIPLVAIELDDKSHQEEERLVRDNFCNEVFAAAGLPYLHFPARYSYSVEEIKKRLRELSAFANL